MLSKNHPIILFIDRTGFSVYQDVLTNIPRFNFTPDIVDNLDVIDKEQFSKLITTFMQINRVVPSNLAIILSDNVVFVKSLAILVQKSPLEQIGQNPKEDLNGVGKDQKDEVQKFLEDVPFEDVLAKVIKIGDRNCITAVNKELVMTIADVFVANKSTIEAIAPSFIFGQNANFSAGLTATNIKIILEDTETLKLGNLLTNQEKNFLPQNLGSKIENPVSDIKPNKTSDVKKPQNTRQLILIGVFITLLIILGVVYFNMGASQTSPKKSKTTSTSVNKVVVPTVAPTAISTVAPTLAQISASPTAVDMKSVRVIITQGSAGVDEKAVILKDNLLKMGFQSISSEISKTSIPEKSSVVFSQNIPTTLRNSVVVEIKKTLLDASALEGQNSNSTINIIIGKS